MLNRTTRPGIHPPRHNSKLCKSEHKALLIPVDEQVENKTISFVITSKNRNSTSLGPPVKEILAPVYLLLELENTIQ